MNNTKILICTLRKQQLNKSLVLYSTLPSPSFGNCVALYSSTTFHVLCQAIFKYLGIVPWRLSKKLTLKRNSQFILAKHAALLVTQNREQVKEDLDDIDVDGESSEHVLFLS